MAVKPSDWFKKIGSFLGNTVEIGSHIHTVSDIIGAFSGKEPHENAPAVVKGLYGVLGKGDERALYVLLEKLETDDPGSREVLAGFFSWHFKHNSFTERTVSWWYGNAFRAFVTQMGSSAGHVEGSEETVVESKDQATGTTTRTTTKKEVRGNGTNNALNFLKMMVSVIRSEQDRVAGYQKLIREFEAFGVPHVPANTAGTVGQVLEGVNARITRASIAGRNMYQESRVVIAQNTCDQKHKLRTRQTNKSWIRRILGY